MEHKIRIWCTHNVLSIGAGKQGDLSGGQEFPGTAGRVSMWHLLREDVGRGEKVFMFQVSRGIT